MGLGGFLEIFKWFFGSDCYVRLCCARWSSNNVVAYSILRTFLGVNVALSVTREAGGQVLMLRSVMHSTVCTVRLTILLDVPLIEPKIDESSV